MKICVLCFVNGIFSVHNFSLFDKMSNFRGIHVLDPASPQSEVGLGESRCVDSEVTSALSYVRYDLYLLTATRTYIPKRHEVLCDNNKNRDKNRNTQFL